MTNVEISPLAADRDSPFGARRPVQFSSWLVAAENSLSRASEWLNPILVKEARQALKSRQFIVTFTLLLVFGWGWSVLGVALLSPGIYYAPGGRTMLTGYVLILLVPMLVIVPFSAFRSLAAEREDGTFELLSITTLNSRQIVMGKLGSAVLQMIVYYSALAPCIAFTYLLRGIDIVTISLLLFYTFLISMMLSAIGLLVGTLSRSRHWQVLLSVSLVIALCVADFIGSWVAGMAIWAGASEFDNFYFWIVQVALLSFYVTFMMLFVLGAAAQISFASDNRSTKLRLIILLQQALWVFWMSYAWLESQEIEIMYPIALVSAAYLYLIGALMSGESGQLSPRVRRTLPQSFFGRTLRTWFNPGAGTGYMFVVLSMWCMAIYSTSGAVIGEMMGHTGGQEITKIFTVSALLAAYVTAYLGVGRLIVLFLRQFFFTGLIVPLLIHIVLIALGGFLPAVIGGWLNGFSNLDYSPLQTTNWAWTLIEAVDGDLWGEPFVPIAVFSFAGFMMLLNLVLAMHEVEQVRLQTPARVVEDEIELHPEKAVQPRRASPWDDEPARA